MKIASRGHAVLAVTIGIVTSGAAGQASAQVSSGRDAIYGRVITDDGAVHEGRLRFGGDEEALWSNYFNGAKNDNPWASFVPRANLQERVPLEVFALTLGSWEREIDLARPFMTRFGDIARIEAFGRDLTVTLKSGSIVDLDRYGADDFADGVRVWEAGSIVDLDERRVRSIEFLPAPESGRAVEALRGTVRTRNGDYSGLVQWDREQCLQDDVLEGISADGAISLPFRTIRAIERRSGESILVSLEDGRAIELSGSSEARTGNRGIYVDDPRYGRVLVRWEAFERVDFGSGGAGAAYDDFPAGSPLTGTVTTRSGMRIDGRLVYDLDESETTDTLDAPWRDVDYTIPFSLIASVDFPGPDGGSAAIGRIRLHGGEALELEAAGDLDRNNAGILVFVGGDAEPQFLPWSDVARMELERPAESFPPIGR